ncbi:MAG: sigma-70 family RNA polymerase sigma factor [Chitinophagaceae bacterium]|nr:MAG: sigma-70 family RNA polymerase sigma factor [Chitinophagaceae bacterium]
MKPFLSRFLILICLNRQLWLYTMKDYQKLLFPYAYNILGSTEDARDTVQEVMYKFTSRQITPDNQKNYLIRAVVNEAINLKKKNARIQPIDNWLPEPVATDKPDFALELNELVSYSIMVLLEKLNPKERAVFILKEAFAYTHSEIADVLGIRVDASRKLLSRGHEKLNQPRNTKLPNQTLNTKPPNQPLNTKPLKNKSQFHLLDKVVEAVRSKDVKGLQTLLSEEIAYTADGGKNIKVVKETSRGQAEVTELMVLVYHRFLGNKTIRHGWINHQPALIYYYRENIVTCQVFEIGSNNQILRISTIVDPAKLKNLNDHG